MKKQSSEDFEAQEQKKLFLILFTRELIRNSGEGRISELKKVLEEEYPKTKEKERKAGELKETSVQREPFPKFPTKPPIKPLPKPIDIRKQILEKRRRQEIPQKVIPRRVLKIKPSYVLRIPEPKLPPEFQYLRPVPGERQIDLGKLNPLVKDPAVKSIECNGPGKRIVVIGSMGIKPTNIILTKEEIDNTIDKFSEISKIPVDFGIYKVVVGKLILSAIISDVVGTRFVIKKMIYPMRARQY
jgi:hypothetical protein